MTFWCVIQASCQGTLRHPHCYRKHQYCQIPGTALYAYLEKYQAILRKTQYFLCEVLIEQIGNFYQIEPNRSKTQASFRHKNIFPGNFQKIIDTFQVFKLVIKQFFLGNLNQKLLKRQLLYCQSLGPTVLAKKVTICKTASKILVKQFSVTKQILRHQYIIITTG